ncbi:Methylcrotonoyl-CoA carboxylase subunit alpha, mitochondrial [Halotydeus destructor]|nr:Methylcrotonoyl-CoA carboxylase subunit alpha, mitochondrial [Halotydeus destructor]
MFHAIKFCQSLPRQLSLLRLASTQHAVKSSLKPLRKILIANRGEIACRVIKTARKMGIKTVAVFSEADAKSLHVEMADEAYLIGPPPASQSYLNQSKIIDVSLRSGAQGIHPGYGFLSENAEFSELCTQKGITFIGPPPSAIRDMGIKSTAKTIMAAASVPVVPGYHGNNQDVTFLKHEAAKIGYPVMIKAIRGGGGKGMRIAHTEDSFLEELDSAKRESLKSFGDDNVLLEKYVENPRHVEVQVFGDTLGNYVYLFERDCSVQRRHQKIIEEAPGPGITSAIRQELGEAAVKAARAVNYVGAGTVEFIYDPRDSRFYFMEMNTRLQVEHPVTEMITDTDLVEWQLKVARGEPLPKTQQDLGSPIGHSFEARIYAEDTAAGFMPGAGPLVAFKSSQPSETVRIETGVRTGDEVSVHYDPMIAKLVVWDKDRESALNKLGRELANINIIGLKTNIDFLMTLSDHEEFRKGNVYTDFIRDHSDQLFSSFNSKPTNEHIAVAAFAKLQSTMTGPGPLDDFRLHGASLPKYTINLKCIESNYEVNLSRCSNGQFQVSIGDQDLGIISGKLVDDRVEVMFNDSLKKYTFLSSCDSFTLFTGDAKANSFEFNVVQPAFLEGSTGGAGSALGGIVAPMPGVIEQVAVEPGDAVKAGQQLVVMIAMKMEYVIKATKDATVKDVYFKVGDNVAKGKQLLSFQE